MHLIAAYLTARLLCTPADTIIHIPDPGEVGMYCLQYDTFRLEVQTETSMTVMAEGPHCDLRNWKHGYSQMFDITYMVQPNGSLEMPDLPKAALDVFPAVSQKEMQDAVRQYCDDFWPPGIEKSKTPHTYPFGVSPSRYIFKLSGTLKNGQQQTIIFLMKVDMGC